MGSMGICRQSAPEATAVHLQFNMPVRPDLLQLDGMVLNTQHAGPFILSGWFWLVSQQLDECPFAEFRPSR